MAVCPNCGSVNNGSKFCSNCGTPLPEEQPVQPVAQPIAQPVQQMPPIQQVQPIQPAPQPIAQPVMEPVVEPTVPPVYQQPVQNVYAQSVTPAANEPKTNGMCKLGFILSMVGIATLGLTSLFGLIFSIVGLISSKKKQEKGRGMAIAGIIVSAIILFVVIFNIAYLGSEINNTLNEMGLIDSTDIIVTTDDDEDEPDDKEELITSINWIEKNSESYLTFGKRNSFKYYQSYTDTTDYYYTGKYELYFGEDAIKVITEDYDEYGLTKDEIESMYTRKELKNLVLLVLKNDGCWIDGENTRDEEWTSLYLGFFEDGSNKSLYLLNLGAVSYFDFVPEDDYEAPAVTTTTTTYDTEETTTSETTAIVETSATSDNSGAEAVGDDIAGYVYLTQGNWGYWTEAGVDPSDYDAMYQRINLETGTIFNLSVYSGVYDAANLPVFADVLKENMESDTGYSGVTSKETTICGYRAYEVSGQYQDGMYLTIWIFIDKNGKMHYNSIEYFASDIASYNMFVDTYTIS